MTMLCLATVAGRIHASSAATLDDFSTVADFLRRQGLSIDKQLTSKELPSISFAAPGCDGMLQVMTMTISLEAVPLFETVVGPGRVGRYIYFGEIWRTADPVALRAKWIKHQALSVLGLERNHMLKTVLFVSEPIGCDAVERINWRPAWNPRTTSPS